MGRFVVDHVIKQRSDKPIADETAAQRLRPAGIGEDAMNAQQLLQEISDYCRQTGLAESTFGRRAVNDGKLANRLRNGGRITTETVDRIQAFVDAHRGAGPLRTYHGGPRVESMAAVDGASAGPPNRGTAGLQEAAVSSARPVSTSAPAPRQFISQAAPQDPQRNFRFFDNRQKYLLFVN